jgi:flagella synthesis protein FlgN
MTSRITREQALDRLLDDIQDDIAACSAIRALLECQFEAALRRAGAELMALSGDLMPQLEAMDERRRQRVQLVRALFGAQATMETLFTTLEARRRDAAAASWRRLEQLVRDCGQATRRNGSLMAEQHAIMQRLLHGEVETYAPR